MRTEIKDKLDAIDSLYTPDRLAESRSRWSALWEGRKPSRRYPWVAEPFTIDYYLAGFTSEELVQRFLDEFIARGFLADDFIPAFFPGCKQTTIPNMFGAKETCPSGYEDWSCERLVENSEDVAGLPEPSLCPGTSAHEWLEIERYLLEETEGRIPVHVTDMQGPGDVCGNLWGYDNFLAAAYVHPQAYSEIMNRAVDAFILLWEAQESVLGEAFVGTHLFGWSWVPKGVGVTVSTDSLVMISPAFYREFYQPFLERLSIHFGGLILHSCGDFSAVVPAVCETQGLRAVNAGQMEIPQIIKAGVNRDVIVICRVGVDELAEMVPMIEDGWRMELTVTGIWPEERKPPSEWTAEDHEYVRRRMEKVNKTLSV